MLGSSQVPAAPGVELEDDNEALYRTGPSRQESLAYGIVPAWTRWAINNMADPVGDEMLVVTNALKRLTVPDVALGAQLQVQDQPIRYSVSGTDPTTTIGFRASAGDIISIGGIPALKAFRAIREGATDANLAVIYFD